MGDISTTTAAIVSALRGESSIVASVVTAAPSTLDQILESEELVFPALIVAYAGAEYQPHTLIGARISDASRTWRVCACARATGAGSDPDADAADLMELAVSVLQGVTVDSGGGELWPGSDELVSSANGRVVYAVEFNATTRMAGI